MKKLSSFFAFLALTLGFISCEKEEANAPSKDGYTYTFTVVDESTRASLDNEGVAWEAKDRVGMFLKEYSGYAEINTEATPKKVILYSPKVIPADSYAYSYYPYNSSNTDPASAVITLSSVQQGGSVSSMPMAGVPFLVETEAPAQSRPNGSIFFLNLGSIIDFKVFSSAYSGETIQYVTFKANNAIVAGEATLDLTRVSKANENTLKLTWGSTTSDNVKVNQVVPVGVSKEDAQSIYMVVAPGTYSGTITIGTDVATYTFNYTEKTLNRNAIKHYNMNLDNALREAEVHETVKSLPYSEPFTTGIGEFETTEPKPVSEVGDIWTQSSSYGMVAKATTGSGASTVDYESEAWLISPWIDLTNVSVATVTFDHVHRYAGNVGDELTFWAKSDEEGAEWTQLKIPNYAPGTNWTFVNSGDISLVAFAGHKVKVAFKYISSKDNAATWEIKNFDVKEVVLKTEFTIAAESISVQIGKTKQNGVSVNSGATISFASEDESIATVDANGNVTGVSEGKTTINVSVPAYNGYPAAEASFNVEVVLAATEKDFSWNLSIQSYASASENEVVWSNDNVTLKNAKGTGTAANNYIPPTRTSSRFYSGNVLTITPSANCEITKIEFTATSDNYASTLSSSTWTNATSAVNETVVTVVPIDGKSVISATVGGTCGLTAVKVYYTGGSEIVETKYSIKVNSTTNGTVTPSKTEATQGTVITLTIEPEAGYMLDAIQVIDDNNNTIAVSNNQFSMPAANVAVTVSFKEKGGAYVLTTSKSTSNTNYASVYDVTVDGVKWSAPGNQNMEGFWRIGGKVIENVDRVIYGKGYLSNNVSQIVINTNGVSNANLKVNSITVTAHSSADDAASGNNAYASFSTTDDLSFAVSTNKSITFVKSGSADCSGKFYRIVFNVTNASSKNYGLDLVSITFE